MSDIYERTKLIVKLEQAASLQISNRERLRKIAEDMEAEVNSWEELDKLKGQNYSK